MTQNQKVLDIMQNGKYYSQKEISKISQVELNNTWNILSRLIEIGLINKIKTTNGIRYYKLNDIKEGYLIKTERQTQSEIIRKLGEENRILKDKIKYLEELNSKQNGGEIIKWKKSRT